ncbi:hypothetical protein PAEN110709_02030 [Paenibacillus endophyticus]
MMNKLRRKIAVFLSVALLGGSLFAQNVPERVFAANPANASYTPTEIVVDGSLDTAWNGKVTESIAKVSLGTVAGSSDLSGSFGVMWDSSYVYVMADITDDVVQNDSSTISDDDGIDLYFDMNHNHSATYGADDFMYQFGYGETAIVEHKHNATAGITVASALRTGGYRIEVKIPWSTLGKTPSSSMTFGFDLMINDDDTGGTRDSQMAWSDGTANAYQSPSLFGDASLTGAPGAVSIPSTSTPITVDGSLDAAWSGKVIQPITKVSLGSIAGSSDLSGSFGVMWDSSYVYVMADITDDVVQNDSSTISDDDGIDLYFDMNHNHSTTYGADDFMYQFGYGETSFVEHKHNATTGITVASALRTGGYRIEVKIPWSTLGKTPTSNMTFGFDLMINDDDTGGTRDSQIAWNDGTANAYQNPSLFGDALLTGSPTPTPGGYQTVPGKVQAESYASSNGVAQFTSGTGDVYVGNTLPGNGMNYSLHVQTAGYYQVVFRVAAPSSDRQFELRNASGTALAAITFNNTGGWENWTTVSATVSLPVGNQSLRIHSLTQGWNIDWLDFVYLTPPPPGPISVTACGATANDQTDDLAAFNLCSARAKLFDRELSIPSGNFILSDIITFDGITVRGAGKTLTTLTSTNPERGSIDLRGDGVELRSLKHTYATVVPRGNGANEKNSITLYDTANFTIDNVWVYKASTAGIFIRNGSNGTISNNTVEDTNADGIHMTHGSSYITVENNYVTSVGDDCIAVVSYTPDGPRVHNITIIGNDVGYDSEARGISVVGGADVTIEDNEINNTRYAGIYISVEAEWNTANVDRITLTGNTIDHTGTYAASGHPNVLVYCSQGNLDEITFNNNLIINAVNSGIGVWGGGTIGDVYFNYNTVSGSGGSATNIQKGTIHLNNNTGF